MTLHPSPLQQIYNLGSLGRSGSEVALAVRGDDLNRIAEWVNVQTVESFSAVVTLHKLSPSRFSYAAKMSAQFVQECVVTLKPVRSVMERNIHRELHLAETKRLLPPGDVVVDPISDEDDVREEISSLRYDLAGPLLEELVLAVDPYPRAPGAAFDPPKGRDGRPQSPFAVLKNLNKP